MAKNTKRASKRNGKTQTRRAWTKDDLRALKGHSKSKTPVAKVSRAMKRTAGAVRQAAFKLGISLGHRR
jgi:hypothetical protein